jgi:4-amino-4-deoxy-L-arabinose transferase-like glycosyltransferase
MKQRLFIIAILLVITAINFSFGFPRLSRYSSVDEPYWTYNRTPDFWRAIAQQKWKNTNINDKPGITTAIISGIGLPWSPDPLTYESLRQEPKAPETAQRITEINFALRLPIYIFTLFGIFLIYFFTRKVFGERTALLATIFIGLSPIILGISLIINPDSLLWIFGTLSILNYLAFYKTDRQSKKYLIFSGIFLGLALLTKYVANILFVYFFALLFLRYIFEKTDSERTDKYFKKNFLDFAIILIISAAVFGLLYPATWKKPEMILEGTFLSAAFKSVWPLFAGAAGIVLLDAFAFKSFFLSRPLNYLKKHKEILIKLIGAIFLLIIAFVLFNTFSGMKIYDFQDVMASPKSGQSFILEPARLLRDFFADPYALIFGLTPLVFLAMLFSLGKNTLAKRSNELSYCIIYFILFIILYYTGSSVNGIGATVRYQIILYPLAMIISAIGLNQAINWLENSRYKFLARSFVVYPAVILVSFSSLWTIRPYYFAYTSSFLPKQFILNLKDMGDGSFEAAQYLNSLPNAQNLIVWSDKGAVCETFVGKCNVGFSKSDTQGIHFDYFVVSTGRKNRSLKLHSAGYWEDNIDFQKLYSTDDSGIRKIIIGDRGDNFVKIARTQDLIKNE